jgi:hypothetical protein
MCPELSLRGVHLLTFVIEKSDAHVDPRNLISITLALWRLRQEDRCEFKANLSSSELLTSPGYNETCISKRNQTKTEEILRSKSKWVNNRTMKFLLSSSCSLLVLHPSKVSSSFFSKLKSNERRSSSIRGQGKGSSATLGWRPSPAQPKMPSSHPCLFFL